MKHLKTFEIFDSIKQVIKNKKSDNEIVNELLNSELDESKISLISDKTPESLRKHSNKTPSTIYAYEKDGKLYKVERLDIKNGIDIYTLKVSIPEFEELRPAGDYFGLDNVVNASESKIRKLFWKLKETYEDYQKILSNYNL